MKNLFKCPCCREDNPTYRDESKFPGQFICRNCCPKQKSTHREDMVAMGIKIEKPYSKEEDLIGREKGRGECEKCRVVIPKIKLHLESKYDII